MAQTPQTYANHAQIFPLFHYFVTPILIINMLVTAFQLYRYPSAGTGWQLIVAVALVGLAFAARVMALKVQDRVIRLEMRLRMQQLLPRDLCARFEELTPSQIVALRFAGDAELEPLVRDVLAGTLQTQKAIKQRVQNWRGDYLRA